MRKLLKYNKWIIAVVSLVTLFFILQIPKVEINNDIKVFLPDDHISKVTNRKIEDIFGESESLVAAVSVKEGTIFDTHNLEEIESLSQELENIDQVDEVTSLTSVDFIEGTSEGMLVENLVKEIPETEKEKNQIKKKLLSWDFYKNNLYSDDYKASQILITLKDSLSTEEKSKVYYQIKGITEDYEHSRFKTYIAGAAAVNVRMGDSMLQDIKILIPFIIVVLIVVLYLFFQSILPVFLIMLTVLISSIWSVGLMAYLGINLTLVSTVIPVLLIAVGSAYGIHILSHYYDYLSEVEGELKENEHREIVLKTIEQLGRPVFLAALTTAVGFGSLASSEIVPIKSFGIFTAIGIAAAFVVALFLIPSLLMLFYQYQSNKRAGEYEKVEHFESAISSLHSFYSKHRFLIVITVLIILVVSAFAFDDIIIDTPLIEMFKEDSPIRIADNFINNHFAGTTIMNILVEGEDRGSLNNPEILQEMDNMQQYITSNYSEVGKMSSIADFIKRMNQVMHYPEQQMKASTEENSKQANGSAASTDSFYQNSESDNQENNDNGISTNSFYQNNNQDNENNSENNNEDQNKENNNVSSFYQDNSNDKEKDNQENNSGDNSDNSTSSFYQSSQKNNSSEEESSQNDGKTIIPGPSREKRLSEYDFIVFLNNALASAEKSDISGDELVELLKKELNYNAAAYYEIPTNIDKYGVASKTNLKNLISQYLLLYSGSVDDMINDPLEPDKAQMLVQIKTPSTITADIISTEIRDYAESEFPEDYQITVSGNARMALAANNLIISSQVKSILISFIIVFIIVSLAFKSPIAGIYGIIPLAFSLVINFALMGYTGIKLDVGTAMVASIAIGIGVDYTIHFLHSYHNYRQEKDDLYWVSRKTLTSTGKAIIFNAISVAAGFLVLLFSNFYPLVYLGLLIAVTMFTSSLAALTILPLLLNIFKPKFISREI